MICLYPNIASYNMRPDDAWALPYNRFRELSDIMDKRLGGGQ